MQNQIDFQCIRQSFSLAGEVSRWVTLRKVGTRFIGICPFHSERFPSFNVYETRGRFCCYGCGARGDIIDFVQRTQPDLTTTLDVIGYLTGGTSRQWLKNIKPIVTTAATARGQEANCVSAYRQVRSTHLKAVYARARLLRESSCAADARTYARERGWLLEPGKLIGAKPYPLGLAYIRSRALRDYPLVGFPKLVMTRRAAALFKLDREFERYGGCVCVGTKVRLTPQALERWRAYERTRGATLEDVDGLPRWLSKPGFTVCIPWEFDSRENAEVLVICEGPGDGVRLYNETYRTENAFARFGRHVHIIAVDSTTAWTEVSLPQQPARDSSRPMSLFDGYRSVVLLLDSDEAGRKAADVIKGLIKKQAPRMRVRDVVFSDAGDVCEFFDQGHSIDDLIEVIRASPPKGSCLNNNRGRIPAPSVSISGQFAVSGDSNR